MENMQVNFTTTELENEVWRPVYADFGDGEIKTTYEVSSLGRVRNRKPLNAFKIHSKLSGTWFVGPWYIYVIRRFIGSSGYLQVKLCHKGKSTTINVHQIVAKAFLGAPPKGHEVDHINSIRTDNRLCNLRYLTHRENVIRGSKLINKRLVVKGKARFQPIYNIFIQPDGLEISYRCDSWAEMAARTGANAVSTKKKLSAKKGHRIHLRCGFTVWLEPKENKENNENYEL